MDPEDKRRGMLLYIRGDTETKEVTHEFGFDEIQAYELFLPIDNIFLYPYADALRHPMRTTSS